MKTYVIASLKGPIDHESALNLGKTLCEIPEIVGVRLTHGPGCFNYGVTIDADEDKAEELMDAITLKLMPARWTPAADRPFVGVIDEIYPG